MDDEEEEILRELLNPKFELIEQHFQHPVPQALRDLYSDKEEVVRTEFIVTIKVDGQESELAIGDYCPINEETLNLYQGFEQYIEFAIDGMECCYLIDPTQDDPEVMFFDMEASEIWRVGATLSAFLSAPRRSELEDD